MNPHFVMTAAITATRQRIYKARPVRVASQVVLRTHSFSSTSLVQNEKSDALALTLAWAPFESSHGRKLRALAEVQAVERLRTFLKTGGGTSRTNRASSEHENYMHTLSSLQHLTCLDASIATFSLHVHARMASLVGKGFYTIGPCGEELLSAGGVAIEDQDATALHYRHTAMSVARQLQNGTKSLDEILLARARGYTVSRFDPVTGGVHCSIGGGPNEYLVTSTLSSQCPPAVGRALGYSLLSQAGIRPPSIKTDPETASEKTKTPISFVTIGDGSLHNHHFLSAFTLARHAKHMNFKCPIVFGISNNGLSISYETKNYLDTVYSDIKDPLVPVFRANGQDMQSIFDQTKQACDYARKYQSPCVLLYTNLVRRFGHAATDRQNSYLDEATIQAMVNTCVLEKAIRDAVEKWNVTTYPHVLDRLEEIHFQAADRAFAQAMNEPKVTLEDMMDRVSAPLVTTPSRSSSATKRTKVAKTDEKPQVLRKNMTRFYDELLAGDSSVVYLGEDVRHGGYYLVTEGLAAKYPNRVLDFPPDETTLLGAGLGFAQLGLTPIVEIPYAKYLDCGVDMFYEIAIQHWLSSTPENKKQAESQSKNGMIVRLQGFDRGLFGGNFHTHNMLSHIPPGVDVVCFSNGRDYVLGMRYAIVQAKAGRIVMVVDCTHLLNLRHLHDRDRQWEFPYPTDPHEVLTFDQVRVYKAEESVAGNKASRAIVTYGNGVVTALQTRSDLVQDGILSTEGDLDVIDCPYLSGVPSQLEEVLTTYDQGVLFADICKEGPGSNIFSSMITSLQQRNSLPFRWAFIGAPRTYNPLGSTVTFLNRDTIKNAFIQMLKLE